MRTYGRIYALNPDGSKQNPQPVGYPQWTEVQTDANGFNDLVYCTTLIQVLLLNLNESPFYANYGIPAKASVIQQVAPDYYVVRTQKAFAQYFANLVVARQAAAVVPTYLVNVTTNSGVKLNANVPIPQ